jgi:hypothetical protein
MGEAEEDYGCGEPPDFQPIWTDKSGKSYWTFDEIEDSHLYNIIRVLEERMKAATSKKAGFFRDTLEVFKIEAKRRISEREVNRLFRQEKRRHLAGLRQDMKP